MLDNYQKTQPIAYKILKNAVSKKKYSHAYLFETNGFYDSYNLIMAFIKEILCQNLQEEKHNPQTCNICSMIDSGNYPEMEIISPDGMWIKKEQLKKLQQKFNKKAIIGDKKIYIIKNAEKLNKQSANSILKFLEEPEEGIIAILVTDNIYELLETIRSRCQLIQLKESKNTLNVKDTLNKLSLILYNKNELEEEEIEKVENTIKFIKYYEQNHLDTIIYMQKLWHDYIKTKEDMLFAFDLMILFYKDLLNMKTGRKIEIFNDYAKDLEIISLKNEIDIICNKINILTEFKEKIKYNANAKLLMDKLVITLEGR